MIREIGNIRNGDLVIRRRHKPSGTTARLGFIVQDRYRKKVFLVQWVDCMATSDLVTHETMMSDYDFVPTIPIVEDGYNDTDFDLDIE